MKKIGISFVIVIGVLLVILVVLGSIGPDTAVYTGRQMPKKYMETIRSLNLLNQDEQIRFFYSDALSDIKSGFYFVTDKNLVLYSSDWEEPETIISFDQIASLEAHYDDSFFEDSTVFVTTYSGLEISFPVSSERELDKKFVGAIQEKLNVEPNAPTDTDKPRR